MRKGQEHSEGRRWSSFVAVQGELPSVSDIRKQTKQPNKTSLHCKSLEGGHAVWHGLCKVLEDIQMFLILSSNDIFVVQPDAVTPIQITFYILPLSPYLFLSISVLLLSEKPFFSQYFGAGLKACFAV